MPTARNRNPAAATPKGGTDFATEAHFTVKYKNEDLGWFKEVSGLSMEVEMTEWAEGGNNDFVHKLPGRIKYPNIQLKAGVTSVAQLTDWIGEVQKGGGMADCIIELKNSMGQPVRRWVFQNAIPVKWTGPNLKTDSNSYAIETLELAHQGLQRQT